MVDSNLDAVGASERERTGAGSGSAVRDAFINPAFVLAILAIVTLMVSGVMSRSQALVVMVALVVLAMGVQVARSWCARRRADTIILIGDNADLGVLASMLLSRTGAQAVRQGRGASIMTVLRVASFDEARLRVMFRRCDLAVISGLPQDGTPAILDSRGKPVSLLSPEQMFERLLGRSDSRIVNEPRTAMASRGPFAIPYPSFKRGIDLVVAVVFGAVIVIPGLIIATVIRLGGGVHVIERLPRVGKDGRPFELYRFRGFTLKDGEFPDVPDVPYLGPRLQFLLYRTHFHLVPMLFNVLKGDLSLIGPKAESPAQFALNRDRLPAYERRLATRPGVVSLAQVRFRFSESLRDLRLAFEYDLYYVKNESFVLDSSIVGQALLLFVRDLGRSVVLILRFMRRTFEQTTSGRKQMFRRSTTLASAPMPRLDGGKELTLRPALLVGAGEGGRTMARQLQITPEIGMWPVAFVDDDLSKVGTRVMDIPVLGSTSAIPSIVQREHIETVVIAMPSATDLDMKRIADIARATDADVLTMPSIWTILHGDSPVTLQQVPFTDFLGRPVITPDLDLFAGFLAGKRVLITGAAGSIGREVARQVAMNAPAMVYGLDINESDLFDLQHEIGSTAAAAPFTPIVASIANRERLGEILKKIKPEIVFHTAAYKHVPLMEEYPAEAVLINTVGTHDVACAAIDAGVSRFVLVSTDKAVRPSSVMGATKRLAELVLRETARHTAMSVCAVRFGNVLGSRGSVIPLFHKQILDGGPVTVTDPQMMRYFMTIPEAVGLIIQAGALGDSGVIYMLDMGEEVSINELAERMIRLHGKRPGIDIDIVYTGLRRGEKLRESLSLDFEAAHETSHPKIRVLEEQAVGNDAVLDPDALIRLLSEVAKHGNPKEIRSIVMNQIIAIDGAVYEEPVALPQRQSSASVA